MLSIKKAVLLPRRENFFLLFSFYFRIFLIWRRYTCNVIFFPSTFFSYFQSPCVNSNSYLPIRVYRAIVSPLLSFRRICLQMAAVVPVVNYRVVRFEKLPLQPY